MGAKSETGMRFLAAEEFAKFPFDPATIKYTGKSWEIDPSKQYPKCYQEFMTYDGDWDLYGNIGAAFDGITMIDEDEVKTICDKRQKKLDDKKAADLAIFEVKMKEELMKRFEERQLLDHEVDTTSIDGMFDIYSSLGGLGADSQQKELQKDFEMLEEIIGELNYEEMSVLKATNPNVFILLIQKVFNFLMYMAHVPIKDDNGDDSHMNAYEKVMDTLFEKNVVDGEVPEWLKKVKLCFDWGKHFGIIVEKAQSGELADNLADIIPHELIANTFISVDPNMLQ